MFLSRPSVFGLSIESQSFSSLRASPCISPNTFVDEGNSVLQPCLKNVWRPVRGTSITPRGSMPLQIVPRPLTLWLVDNADTKGDIPGAYKFGWGWKIRSRFQAHSVTNRPTTLQYKTSSNLQLANQSIPALRLSFFLFFTRGFQVIFLFLFRSEAIWRESIC